MSNPQQGKNVSSNVSNRSKGNLSWLLLMALLITVTFFITNRYSYASELKASTDFEAYSFQDNQGGTLPYRLLKPLPENANGFNKYPLILYLHGTGERGSDNIKQLKYIDALDQPSWRQKYPSFILVPQCPEKQNWVEKESYSGTVPQSEKPAKSLWQTVELIRQLENKLPVDSDRIYIIGTSSGGSGVWDLVARYPHMFAAAAPFCGSGDDQKADLMINTPIWAFHGGRDILVNPNTTRKMIQAIQKAGGHPKYTEYPNMFHNVWSKTFQDPQFFQWLFEQKRV